MTIGNSVAILRQKLSQSIGLPFASILPQATFEQVLKEEKITYRKRLFCPIVTLWAWLSQVLDPDKSCKKAVSRVVAFLAAEGQPLPSTNTAAYCKARQRLKRNFLLRLVRQVGAKNHQDSSSESLWCGRRVVVVDGSTLIMADTPENQKEYPQSKNQALGCGFPLARIVALFSLVTGAVLDSAISAFGVGEVNLFRQMFNHLKAFDVVLGDRLFGSYADICQLKDCLVDAVFRMHQKRKTDFRKGKRLGKKDHILLWPKPLQCPKGLSKNVFEKLPQQLLVREVQFEIPRKGFRTKRVTLVTTLLKKERYPKEALAQLYGLRWQVEISLRHLKGFLKMEFLLSKTPSMVQAEFYVHLLAYNLIRSLQWEALKEHRVVPTHLSFSATVQHFGIFATLIAQATAEQRQHLYSLLKVLVALEKLPVRPNRVEPRAVKRRPKGYPWLKEPRAVFKRKYAA
jgi:hypothetical protein